MIYGLLSIVILVVAVAVSVHLVNAKPQPKKDNKKHNVTYVKTAPVNYSEKQTIMNYRGRVTAYDIVSLSAEVSGKIVAGDVRFKAGERFRKGDVLVHIYSEDVKASLKSGKSTYLQTLSSILPDIKVDFPEEYDKWMAFFTALDIDKPLPTLPEIKTDKEKVFLAANNILGGYYSIQQQEINLTRYTLIAPFNGSFKTVNKEIGAVSSPGVELASIIRTDKLEVTVPVFPADLTYIKVGEKVNIINNSGVHQEASVSRISDFVESSTQSVNVYLTYNAFANVGFLEGEYVDVNFSGASTQGFEIPREAIVDGDKVYVLEDKKLRQETITIVRQMEDSYIITIADTTAQIVVESMASINANSEYQTRN